MDIQGWFPLGLTGLISLVSKGLSRVFSNTTGWKKMKVKEESEKADLKLNIQKTKIMASGPITSWAIDGETVETVTDFIFLGSKIIADDDHTHEIKLPWLLGRKTMTNIDSILKRRDINLPTKVHIVKAMVFPAVIMGVKVGP